MKRTPLFLFVVALFSLCIPSILFAKTVNVGDSVTLNYNTASVSNCGNGIARPTGGFFSVSTGVSSSVTFTAASGDTGTYTLTCTGLDGTIKPSSDTLTVTAVNEPIGNFEGATCGVNGISGWACDKDHGDWSIDVHFYDGASYVSFVTANQVRRADADAVCGGAANHGFQYTLPDSLKDGTNHTLHVYGINVGPTGTNNAEILTSKVINCPAAATTHMCTNSATGNTNLSYPIATTCPTWTPYCDSVSSPRHVWYKDSYWPNSPGAGYDGPGALCADAVCNNTSYQACTTGTLKAGSSSTSGGSGSWTCSGVNYGADASCTASCSNGGNNYPTCTPPSYTCGVGATITNAGSCNVPANASGQTNNLVASCGAVRCSYTCNAGWHISGTTCVVNNCTDQSKTWLTNCSGSTGSTANGASANPSYVAGGYTGSATYSCDGTTNTYTYVSGSCTATVYTCAASANGPSTATAGTFTPRGASTANGTWAYAASGECTWSCNSGYTRSGTTCVIPPPTTPTGFTVGASTCGNYWLNLSWNASSGADSYDVYKDGSFLLNTALTAISNSAASGSYHSYYVKAKNTGGSSSQTGTLGATVASECTTILESLAIPDSPASASGSCPSPGTSATLSWSASTGATYYQIRVDNTSNGWSGVCNSMNSGDYCNDNVSATSYPFSSIAGASYGTWVHACNSVGCSSTATAASFTCAAAGSPSAPLTVPNCAILSGASTCNVSVSWSSANLTTTLSVRQNGTQFSTAASSGGTSRTLSYGSGASNTFTTVHNGSTLDTKTGTASCDVGLSWSGGVCTPTVYSCGTGTGVPSGGGMTKTGATGPSQSWAYSSPGTAACTWYCNTNYTKSGNTCVANGCGTQAGSIQPSEPTGTNACSSGTLNSSSPANTTLRWNWSCGTLTCWAEKPGCNIVGDANYNASGPNNDYNCSGTCGNGSTGGYPSCPDPVDCYGTWSDNGICSVNINPPPNNCGRSGHTTKTFIQDTAAENGGSSCTSIYGVENGGTAVGSSCTTSACPSGYFTPASASCIIPDNSNSCSANVSWTTTTAVPGYTSAVTKDGVGGNFQSGNDGGPIPFSTNYSSQIYRLYNYGRQLDTITVTSDCLASSARSGGLCLPCQNGSCGTAPVLPHLCNNGTRNPPACNICSSTSQYWDAPSLSCKPCGGGDPARRCNPTGCAASQASYKCGLTCFNGSIDPPTCTPRPNQTITLNGGTNIYLSNYPGVVASMVWNAGTNHALYPYSSCSASGPWGGTFPGTQFGGSGNTIVLTAGGAFTHGYSCTNPGGTTAVSATVTVCSSNTPVLMSAPPLVCQGPPTATLALTPLKGGQYSPTGHLLVGTTLSDSCTLWYYKALRNADGTYNHPHTLANKVTIPGSLLNNAKPSINFSGDYYVTCTKLALDGHTFSQDSQEVQYRSEPPTPIVYLKQVPATISKGSASIISWVVIYPNPVQNNPARAGSFCTLNAATVCPGSCSTSQIAAQDAVNAIISTGLTDANDPSGPSRLISPDALNTIVPPYSTNDGETDWKATGKKTFNLSNTMDFELNCHGPGSNEKIKIRVNVTSSNEG